MKEEDENENENGCDRNSISSGGSREGETERQWHTWSRTSLNVHAAPTYLFTYLSSKSQKEEKKKKKKNESNSLIKPLIHSLIPSS